MKTAKMIVGWIFVTLLCSLAVIGAAAVGTAVQKLLGK